MSRFVLAGLLGIVFFGMAGQRPPARAVAADEAPATVNYEQQIKPLLTKYCVSCHGAEKQKSGLRLDTGAAALQGGDSGAAIFPGKAGESLLIQVLIGAEGVA